ncbi:hypothetical protein GGH99_004763, partial [Coemansia sp. RSA 1285]
GSGLVDSSNAKDLDNAFGSSAGKDAVDSLSSSPSALGSLGIQSMANISPRLSLRLSSDASTFGFGLSALASLISSDDASAAAAAAEAVEGEGEEAKVVVAPAGSGESKDAEAAATRVSDEVDSDRMSLDIVEDTQQKSEPQGSVPAKEEETGPKEPSVADKAREEEDMENPTHARLRSLRSRRLQQQQEEKAKELAMAGGASAEAASKGQKSTKKKPEPPASSGGAASKKKPLSKMGPLQLDRLTKLNTRRNATYMTCKIELVVVQRDGERPPSPSLVMQEKAQLRRALRGPDSGELEYRSIYSESSGAEDAEEEEEEESGSDSRALVDHSCALTPPSSPYASADEAAGDGDCAAPDARRKPAAGRVRAGPDSAQQQQQQQQQSASDESGANKKQCCRPRVRWGSRSVLQNTWLLGREPDAESRPGKSILAVRSSSKAGDSDSEETNGSATGSGSFVTTRAAKRASRTPGGSVMNLIRVACIEYPDSLDDIEDLYSDDDGEKSIESDSSDEYMQPRPKKNSAAAKGKGRKTKERAPSTMAASASSSLPSLSLDDQDSFVPRRSSRKK